jgi:ribokinase
VLDLLVEYAVDVAHVTMGQDPSGHAIIYVDPQAENVIVTFAGANHSATRVSVEAALAGAALSDTLLLQNEPSAQIDAARFARARGLRVIYSAAPFQIKAVRAVLPEVSMLVMNAGEAAELRAAFDGMPQIDTIVTRGAEGAEWLSPGAEPSFIPSFRVTPVDTTGAGDCFIGTLAAALDAGADRPLAMRRAAASAALQVTRAGAAQAMPLASEVDAFLA